MKKLNLLSVLVVCFSVSTSFAGLLFQYNRLALKDLDQMNKLVQDKIHESQKTKGDQEIPLKEALQAVYSRPNEDFMIEKVITPLRNELDEHDAYESSIRALVKEATGALKNPKAFTPVAQVTYAIFLENLVAEMKPKAGEGFEKEILTTIRDAKIELTKPAKNERALRMMKETKSPSTFADEALKAEEEAAKAREEEKKKKKDKKEEP